MDREMAAARPGLDVSEAALADALEAAGIATRNYGRDRTGPIVPAGLNAELDAMLSCALPSEGIGLQAVVSDVIDKLHAAATRTNNPRFLGLITTGGNPYGLVGEYLSAGMNQHVTKRLVSPMASAVEDQVLRWIGEFVGFDARAAGVLTSGGSMANLTALAAAVQAKAPFDVSRKGLVAGPPLCFYTSDQAHLSVEKAISILGLGTESLTKIPTDADFRMDPAALEAAILKDRSQGRHPVCVIATAGTVNTGAVDPLEALAPISARHGLWLHVDGAYGVPAAATEIAGPLFKGLHLAQSVAVDAHKWFYTPYEAACLLVHDADHLRNAFRFQAIYAVGDGAGIDYMDAGPQMSRDFKALKIWCLFRGAGANAVRLAIEHDIRLMRRLGTLIDEHPRLERLAPIPLSIACFRYVPPGVVDDAYIDDLNHRVADALRLDGRLFMMSTLVRGRVGLRACCVNYRADESVIRQIVDVVDEIGGRLHAKDDPVRAGSTART